MLDTLSVVIPTRNEAALIGRFLAALPEWVELVVVDASDDETPAIIERTRPYHTRLIRSPASIAEAREIGAAAARGEWLIFSDADVRFAPGYFERFARYAAPMPSTVRNTPLQHTAGIAPSLPAGSGWRTPLASRRHPARIWQ